MARFFMTKSQPYPPGFNSAISKPLKQVKLIFFIFVFMNYRKNLKPIGRITLIVMIGGLIFGIVELFQGSDDWGLVITPIFCIIFLLVFIPFLEKVNKHPNPQAVSSPALSSATSKHFKQARLTFLIFEKTKLLWVSKVLFITKKQKHLIYQGFYI